MKTPNKCDILSALRTIPFGPEPGSPKEAALAKYLEENKGARAVIVSIPKYPIAIVRVPSQVDTTTNVTNLRKDPSVFLGLAVIADTLAGIPEMIDKLGRKNFSGVEKIGYRVEEFAADTFAYMQKTARDLKPLSVVAIQFSVNHSNGELSIGVKSRFAIAF